MAIRVLCVDDEEVIREGVKCLVEGSGIEVVAEAESGDEAVRKIIKDKEKIELVLLDIRMPDGEGLNALARIKMERPVLPVLVFSAFDNPSYVARAVALGASGYLTKGISREEFLDSVRKAAAGDSAWTRDGLRRVTGALSTPRINADVEVPLTQRESEVLRMLASGATNKEIGKQLNISFETVKEHVQHILRKIGVSDRTQAAVWAVRKGLV